MFEQRGGLIVVLVGTESCLCRALQVLGWCWGHTAAPGAQPWLLLSYLRHLGGLWDQAAASTPPPQPGNRAAQGQPKAHQQVHGDVAGLQVRWEAILQVRVRNESELGNQGWAQPHDGEAGPWRWDRPEVKVGCQCTDEDPQAPWTGRGSSAAEDPGLSQN